MKVCANICEYNPFHNGHKYIISESKKLGYTHFVAIMSGNFTQRGDTAILSKWARTKSALLNGVNLVIDLPTPFSMATAEKFAFGSVFLADALGCVDTLIFGSECSNIDLLEKIACTTFSKEFNVKLKENLNKGITFAKARENAICSILEKELSDILNCPNNILAIEYIKALKQIKSDIMPLPILRQNVFHDSNIIKENFASASQIRQMILNNTNNYLHLMPKSAYEVLLEEIKNKKGPSNIKRINLAILAVLRTLSKEQISSLPNISEGLDNKIYKEIKNSQNLEELYNNIKSKRYTSSRIRRIILSAFLGINKTYTSFSPSYIKVLGFDPKGAQLLHKIKESATLPIITKYSDVSKLNNKNIENLFELECRLSDLYSLTLPKIPKCNLEKTSGIITIK